MGSTVSSPSGVESPLYDRQTFPRTEKKLVPKVNTIERSDTRNHASQGNQENSRMLFLMYLLNRTWNVVVDGKGGKRWVFMIASSTNPFNHCVTKNENETERKVSKRWRMHKIKMNLTSFSLSFCFALFFALFYLQTISFVCWFQRWWNVAR